MNNYGELIDQNTLQFKRVLPGKIERVWQYLIDPELRGKWFASGAIDLNPQGVMELNFHHQSLVDSLWNLLSSLKLKAYQIELFVLIHLVALLV